MMIDEYEGKIIDNSNEIRQELRAKIEYKVINYLCGELEIVTDTEIENVLSEDSVSEEHGIFIDHTLNKLNIKGDD